MAVVFRILTGVSKARLMILEVQMSQARFREKQAIKNVPLLLLELVCINLNRIDKSTGFKSKGNLRLICLRANCNRIRFTMCLHINSPQIRYMFLI